MNGVCVVWKGWIDLQRLDGAGYLEFDEDYAKVSHTSTNKFSFLVFIHFVYHLLGEFDYQLTLS